MTTPDNDKPWLRELREAQDARLNPPAPKAEPVAAHNSDVDRDAIGDPQRVPDSGDESEESSLSTQGKVWLVLAVLVIGPLIALAVHYFAEENRILDDAAERAEQRVEATTTATTTPAAEVTTACLNAMSAAADVPLSQDNNAELYVTFSACSSYDEWRDALRDYPNAMAAQNIDESTLKATIANACRDASVSSAPVCSDLSNP